MKIKIIVLLSVLLCSVFMTTAYAQENKIGYAVDEMEYEIESRYVNLLGLNAEEWYSSPENRSNLSILSMVDLVNAEPFSGMSTDGLWNSYVGNMSDEILLVTFISEKDRAVYMTAYTPLLGTQIAIKTSKFDDLDVIVKEVEQLLSESCDEFEKNLTDDLFKCAIRWYEITCNVI